VADLNTNADNPVIGTRSFGTEPQRAGEHVAAWVRGVQAAGTAACVKHFPGHGDTADDSHLSLPVVTADLETLTSRELVPFASAVAAGCRAVMTSHIVVTSIDPELPATFSAPMLSVLRNRLGFAGPVVSDALDMAGATGSTRTIPEAAVLSLAAGVDLLCLGPETDPVLVRQVRDAIVDAVTSGGLAEDRLREAAARAGTARVSTSTTSQPGIQSGSGASEAIRIDGTLPRLTGARLVRVDSEPSIAVGPVPWGLPTDLAVHPDDPAAVNRLLDAASPLVLQVRDAHRHPGTLGLVERIAPAAVIEWGWPGPWPGAGVPRIRTHGTSMPMYAAVRQLLAEKGWTE
jgi:beta-N-acetylhexosaminidase